MYLLFVCAFFFFFKQKTAYEMRISDWSSDVCSSDLADPDHADCRVRSQCAPMRGLYRAELSRLPAYCRADCCHHETIAPAPAAALSHVDPSAARKDQHPAIERLRPSLYGLWYPAGRSEQHTSELQSLMRSSYDVCCL